MTYERLLIEDMTSEGVGIGHADGLAVFVPSALYGDIVTAEEVERKKSYARARLLWIDEPSSFRVEPDCPCSESCGGCAYRSLSYETELALKEKQLRDKLERIAGIKEPEILPIIPHSGGSFYRSKGVWHASGQSIGFYAKASRSIVEPEDCLIQSEAANAVITALRKHPLSDRITALLDGITIKTAGASGELMLILEGRPGLSEEGALEELIYAADDAAAEAGGAFEDGEGPYSLESVWIKENPALEKGGGSNKKKAKLIHLAGKRTIEDELLGLRLEISPEAFYQTNHEQCERLYEKLLELAELKGDETVFDLYCGVGSIGLLAARRAKYVYGIEIVPGAVLDANRNATINGIVNIEFLLGKAEEKIFELLPEHKPDVLIADPPRAGLHEKLINAMAESGAEKLIYVSCDPGTLARDLRRLEEKGFSFVNAQPVDMFPRTAELETVVLMSRVKG